MAGNIHQDDVTSAGAAAALVLVGELSRGCDRAAEVLQVLGAIAVGSLHQGPVDADAERDARTRLLAGDVEQMTMNSLGARAAVWAALRDLIDVSPRYLDWSSEACPYAIEAACALGDRAEALQPALLALARSNPRPGEHRLLETLARSSPLGAHLDLHRSFLAHADPRARTDAALALAFSGDTSDDTLDELARAAVGHQVPYALEVLDPIVELLGDRATAFLDRVVRRAGGFHTAVDAVYAWLLVIGVEVPGGTRSTADSVEYTGPATNVTPSPALVEVVNAAVLSRGLWKGRTNLFELLGLPISRDELAAWAR